MTTSSNPTTSSLSRPNPSQPPSPNLSSNHHEKSHVIDILPTATAQTHSHLHPFLLLALYAFRFQSLVADPVSTLWSDLPLYAVLQITYAVTCLPQAGSSHQHHAGSSRNDTNAIGEISESSKRHVSASASTLASAAKRKRTHKSDSFPQKVTVRLLSASLDINKYSPPLYRNILILIFTGSFHLININLPPRHPRLRTPSHPFRRPVHHSYSTHIPLRSAHGPPHSHATHIRPRRQRHSLASNMRLFMFRRYPLGWCNGCLHRSVGWCCSYSIGLVRLSLSLTSLFNFFGFFFDYIC